MTASKYWLLALFYLFQIFAYTLFKFGSMDKARWIPCFILGNCFGLTCMWILMKLYTVMNANVATGLSIGGGFLCGQIAIAVIFRTDLSFLQWGGIATITAGLLLLGMR